MPVRIQNTSLPTAPKTNPHSKQQVPQVETPRMCHQVTTSLKIQGGCENNIGGNNCTEAGLPGGQPGCLLAMKRTLTSYEWQSSFTPGDSSIIIKSLPCPLPPSPALLPFLQGAQLVHSPAGRNSHSSQFLPQQTPGSQCLVHLPAFLLSPFLSAHHLQRATSTLNMPFSSAAPWVLSSQQEFP